MPPNTTWKRWRRRGRSIFLQLKAKTKTVAYDQLKMWADKDKKLPTKIECLTEASMLIKTLYFKEIKDFGGGIVRPSVIETDSPLYKGYKSVMIFAKIKKRDFKDEVFTLTFHAEHRFAALRLDRRLFAESPSAERRTHLFMIAMGLILLSLPGAWPSRQEYKFDLLEIEKKPYHLGGYGNSGRL